MKVHNEPGGEGGPMTGLSYGTRSVATALPSRDASERSQTDAAPNGEAHNASLHWLTLAAVVLGCVIRVVQWLARRSLWLDEASLAFNVVHRPWGDLAKPLTFSQGAPLGFIYIERAAVLVLGNNEYALRLWPLLCGCATLELTRRVGLRLVGQRAALLATLLVATCPSLIRYSNEVKQYSTDSAVALAVTISALRALERSSPRRWVEFSLLGAASLWMSHAALFVGAGVIGYIFARACWYKDWSMLRRTVLVGVVFLFSSFELYRVSLRKLAADPVLLDYWHSGFAPRPLRPGSLLPWTASALLHAIEHPIGARYAIAWSAVVVVSAALAIRRQSQAFILALPMIMALIAAVLAKYPFQDRLILFAVAPTFILSSAIFDSVWDGIRRRGPHRIAMFGAIAITALSLGPSGYAGSTRIYRVETVNESRPVFQYLAAHADRDDSVLAFYGSQPSYYYYQYLTGIRVSWDLYPSTPSQGCDRFDFNSRRTWVVFTFDYLPRAIVLEKLRTLGALLEKKEFPGAGAYLFDFSVTSTESVTASGPACFRLQTPLSFGPANLATRPFGAGAHS